MPIHCRISSRVVMRREQVLKICLNHVLIPDIEYLPKDDKTWLFTAPDFSEGEINHQQFCLRFKTPEIAIEFKNAIDNALEKPGTGGKSDVCKTNHTTFVYGACFVFVTVTIFICYYKLKK